MAAPLLALAGLAFLAWVIAADARRTAALVASARPDVVALGTLCFVGQTPVVAAVWRRLFAALGGEPPPLATAYRLLYLGAASKYLPGGGGWGIAATAALARGTGLPAGTAATASTALVAAVAGAGGYVGAVAYALWLLRPAPAVAVAVLCVACAAPLAGLPLGRARSAHAALEALALANLSWLLVGLGALSLATAVTPVAAVDGLLLLASSAVAWLAAILALGVPAGIGVRDAVQVATVGAVLPTPTATAFALLVRLGVTAADLLAILAALALHWRLAPGPRASLPSD